MCPLEAHNHNAVSMEIWVAREQIQLHHLSSLMKKAEGKAGTAELAYCRRKTVTFSFVVIHAGFIGQILDLARL